MSVVVRNLLLGLAAAFGLGIGLAIVFTAETDSGKAEGSLAKVVAKSTPAEPPPVAVAPVPPPAPQIIIPPMPAPYAPAVTEQIHLLERQMADVRDSARKHEDVIRDLVGEVKEAVQSQTVARRQPEALEPPAQPAPPAVPPKAPSKSEVQSRGTPGKISLTLVDAPVREVLEKLGQEGGIQLIPGKSVGGTISLNLEGVDVAAALDVVLKQTGLLSRTEGRFVYVGTAEELATVERANDKLGKRIYRPNYVKASELQKLLEPYITAGVGLITISSPASVGIPADNTTTGGDSFAGNEVLLVRDYERVLSEIDHLMLEIDCQPSQVAIEAMILSVKLTDTNSLGVDFELLRDKNNVRLISGTPLSDLASIDVTKGGLKFGFLDSSLGLFISALETVGDTNVVASPHLMCLNKQRAEILIGSQLGYVNTTVTETSSTQSVSFLEVGTQLRLRPFIASDGNIRMEVHPELSTGSVRIEGGLTLPNKDVTQVTTNIMVRDGSTVIIGGLIRSDLETSGAQIPFLGSSPVIGPLFRQKKETTGKHEIIVLITPRIVSEPQMSQNGKRAECDFLQRQLVYAEQMSPLGRRYLGRRYLRMAKAAWESGDTAGAVRLAHLAVHYDPLNRESIDFRGVVVNETGGAQPCAPWLRIPVQPCPPGAPCAAPVMPWDAGPPEGPGKIGVWPNGIPEPLPGEEVPTPAATPSAPALEKPKSQPAMEREPAPLPPPPLDSSRTHVQAVPATFVGDSVPTSSDPVVPASPSSTPAVRPAIQRLRVQDTPR